MLNKLRHWLTGAWRPAPVRIAVFIDTDGISPQVAEDVMYTVKQHGHVRLLRTYGNHRGRAAITWGRFLNRHKGEARHLQALTRGKNASDVALSIDAVEVLLTRHVEIFVRRQ